MVVERMDQEDPPCGATKGTVGTKGYKEMKLRFGQAVSSIFVAFESE